jgi:hypothetical protein
VAAGICRSVFDSVCLVQVSHNHVIHWFETFQVLIVFCPSLASTGSTPRASMPRASTSQASTPCASTSRALLCLGSCLLPMPPKKKNTAKKSAGGTADRLSGPLGSPVRNGEEVLLTVSAEPELPAETHSLVSPPSIASVSSG